MPEWFWETTNSSRGQQSVGYSKVYEDIYSSYQEAFEDAAWRLYRDKGCWVRGERAQARVSEGVMSLGNNISFEVDSAGFDQFSQNLARIDSFACEGMVIALISTQDMEVSRTLKPSPTIPIIENFTSKNLIVGTGISKPYHYIVSSWQEAEISSRVEAAFAKHTGVRSLDRNLDDYAELTMVIQTDTFLKITKTYRAIEPETGFVWVIVIAEP